MRNGVQIRVVIHLENKYYLSQVRIDTSISRDRVGLSTLTKMTNNHIEIINKIKPLSGMREEGVIGTIDMEFIKGSISHYTPVDVLDTEHGDFGVIIGIQTSSFFGFQTTHFPEVVDVSSSSSEGEGAEARRDANLDAVTIFDSKRCMLS